MRRQGLRQSTMTIVKSKATSLILQFLQVAPRKVPKNQNQRNTALKTPPAEAVNQAILRQANRSHLGRHNLWKLQQRKLKVVTPKSSWKCNRNSKKSRRGRKRGKGRDSTYYLGTRRKSRSRALRS